jgi:hypothetical protein
MATRFVMSPTLPLIEIPSIVSWRTYRPDDCVNCVGGVFKVTLLPSGTPSPDGFLPSGTPSQTASFAKWHPSSKFHREANMKLVNTRPLLITVGKIIRKSVPALMIISLIPKIIASTADVVTGGYLLWHIAQTIWFAIV